MMQTVLYKEYSSPEIDRREIMRYMGATVSDNSLLELIDECITECSSVFCYKVCYSVECISVDGDIIDFRFTSIKSHSLSKNLYNCSKAVVFAATVGLGIDRLIKKYSRVSPVKALCFQAIGTERIEALCDVFCKDLFVLGELRSRFSPGYGDLDLEIQANIFSVLNCEKMLGLTLNKNLIMSPSKSVTAIVGISEKELKNEFS